MAVMNHPVSALNHQAFEQARQARDPRFDGQFFIGVKTTGIYCRPVCPVKVPRPENVLFFPSAAAAGEAGFRPCLRCRPESSPGTPAWAGTSTTVSATILPDNAAAELAWATSCGAIVPATDARTARYFAPRVPGRCRVTVTLDDTTQPLDLQITAPLEDLP